MNDARVWFITGASSGFGYELAEAALSRGDQVAMGARRVEKMQPLADHHGENALPIQLDVTDPRSVQAAIDETHSLFGKVDVLVNNAGYGVVGAVEESDPEQIRAMFETNYFGVLNVLRAALPRMRARRSGHILQISSIAGLVGFPGSAHYGATKHALEAMSEALAREVGPLGIKVTIVEPGAFRTAFTGSALIEPTTLIDDYAETAHHAVKWFKEVDGHQQGDPKKAVDAMIKVVESPEPPLRLLLGPDAVGNAEKKIALLQRDLLDWREVSVGTDFPTA